MFTKHLKTSLCTCWCAYYNVDKWKQKTRILLAICKRLYLSFPLLTKNKYKGEPLTSHRTRYNNVNKHTTQLRLKEWRNIPNKKHVVKIFHTNFSDRRYPPTCWGEIPPLFILMSLYFNIDRWWCALATSIWLGYRHLNKIPRRPSLFYLNQSS